MTCARRRPRETARHQAPGGRRGVALAATHALLPARCRALSVLPSALARGREDGRGVGYHHKAALSIPNNITFIALPTHAPELDPIEYVWQYLCQNVPSHWIVDDCAQIVDACADA
jgi:hypothetical protein